MKREMKRRVGRRRITRGKENIMLFPTILSGMFDSEGPTARLIIPQAHTTHVWSHECIHTEDRGVDDINNAFVMLKIRYGRD